MSYYIRYTFFPPVPKVYWDPTDTTKAEFLGSLKIMTKQAWLSPEARQMLDDLQDSYDTEVPVSQITEDAYRMLHEERVVE